MKPDDPRSGPSLPAYVDLHCHMLPGIDDGSKSLDQSIAMAEMAVADGIGTMVLTPHHLNGIYINFSDFIRDQVDNLRRELRIRGIELELLPGSELHLVPELPEQLAAGRALTIADRGRAALVELPVHTVPVGSTQVLGQLLDMGIQPVIAHPERNSGLRRHPEQLTEWVDMGCLAQVTAQSCTGRFGREVRRAAREMIQSGVIHIMASDAHRDKRRIPELSMGHNQVSKWVGPAAARLMTETCPGRLACGGNVNSGVMQRMVMDRPGKGWLRKWF